MSKPVLDRRKIEAVNAVVWVGQKRICLDGQPVDFFRHPYQLAAMQEEAPRQCAIVHSTYSWGQNGG